MKAKKLICLAVATLGLAALLTGCEKKENNALQGDTFEQGSESGGQSGGNTHENNQQSGNQGSKPGETVPGSGAQDSQPGGSGAQDSQPGETVPDDKDKEEQENPGSQGEQSGSQGEQEGHEHNFVFHTTKEASCLAGGEEEGVCACGEKTTRKTNPLEHSYGEVKIENGEKYRICSRCGNKDYIEEMMDFQINLIIEEGCDFTLNEKTQILVYKDSSVYKIFDAKEHLTITLPRGKYVVRADNMGEAYQQVGYYEISENKPSADIVIGNNPDFDREIDRHVNVGDKMFNFLVKDTKKKPEEYQRFYELLEGKKLIFIDFFFVACNPCEYMLEEELKFYNTLDEATKEKFLMIMIDKENQDTAENINSHREGMQIPDEIITMQKGAQAYKNFENWNLVPHGAFLDENGIILEISSGWNFAQMIQKHLQGGRERGGEGCGK